MTPNQYTFRYRVRNWSDYNRALIARGRLTFWFDEDAVAAWRNADPPKGPGAPKVYSDTAIQCALILKSVFHLSLRSTQGFVSSLLELLRLDLPVPDYSTLSRRQSSLATFLTVSPRVRSSPGASPTGLAESSSLALRMGRSSQVALHLSSRKRSYHCRLQAGNVSLEGTCTLLIKRLHRPPPRFLDNRLEDSLSNLKSMGHVLFPPKSANEVSA